MWGQRKEKNLLLILLNIFDRVFTYKIYPSPLSWTPYQIVNIFIRLYNKSLSSTCPKQSLYILLKPYFHILHPSPWWLMYFRIIFFRNLRIIFFSTSHPFFFSITCLNDPISQKEGYTFISSQPFILFVFLLDSL